MAEKIKIKLKDLKIENKEKVKLLSLKVPLSLHKEFKDLCEEKNIKMTDVLKALLREFIKQNQ